MAQQFRDADPAVTLRERLTEMRRYLSVGVICAVLHNLIVISANRLGLHYVLALLLSFIIVTPTGYVLHTLHTFDERFSWLRFGRFTSGIIGGSLISLAIMFVLCTLLKVPVFIATPLATVALFIWNYSSARWAVVTAQRRP